MRILGLDPSLSSTGWGVIDVQGNRLRYVADGFIPTGVVHLPRFLARSLPYLVGMITKSPGLRLSFSGTEA